MSKQKDFAVKRTRAGLGLFSQKPFSKGDFVIEYTGKLLTTQEADEKCGRYLFEVNSRWTVDGSEHKNLARYINHSCRPNCEPEIEGRKIMLCAIKKIQPGEELTYNYGREYFKDFIKPNGCRCDHCSRNRK